MSPRNETLGYLLLMGVLSLLLVSEGRTYQELRAQSVFQPQDLYRKISKSQEKLQIIDVRPDVSSNYEDIHIPGSIPFPECDPSKMDSKVMERIFSYAPTIIVSKKGDSAEFERCRPFFRSALNLAGGIDGWLDSNLPEDSGEYVPPKSSAGGGCL